MSAIFLATTSQKFSTSFCSFWQSYPAYFPLTWLLPCPAPITRQWKLWSCNHYLAPAVTSLVSCRLSVLYDWELPLSGEYLFIDLPFCVKSCFRAWLIHSKLLVRSYSNITNRYNGLMKLSKDSGVVAKEHWKCWCSVIVGCPCIPFSSFTSFSKNDTVLQPLKAWTISNAIHRSGPRALAIS